MARLIEFVRSGHGAVFINPSLVRAVTQRGEAEHRQVFLWFGSIGSPDSVIVEGLVHEVADALSD